MTRGALNVPLIVVLSWAQFRLPNVFKNNTGRSTICVGGCFGSARDRMTLEALNVPHFGPYLGSVFVRGRPRP